MNELKKLRKTVQNIIDTDFVDAKETMPDLLSQIDDVENEIDNLDNKIKRLTEDNTSLESELNDATDFDENIKTGRDTILYSLEAGNLLDMQIMEALKAILEDTTMNHVNLLQTLQSFGK